MTKVQRKDQILLVVYMYLVYAGFMVLKTAIAVASPELIASGLITKTQWGEIISWGTIGAILGKLVSGVGADKFGGKFTFTAGIFITSLGVLLFSQSTAVTLFSAMFFLTLFAKSFGWPSMAKLIGNWYDPRQYGKVWGVLSTSSRVGTMTALFVLGLLLKFVGWKIMLLVAAGAGLLLTGLSAFLIRETPPDSLIGESRENNLQNESRETEESNWEASGEPSNQNGEEHAEHPLKGTTLAQALLVFATSLRFWLIALSMMGLTILWDFLDFLPIYLTESLKVSTADASLITTAFPSGAFVSVLISGYLFDSLKASTIPRLMGFFLFLAVVSLVVLFILPDYGLDASVLVKITLACLFVFGFTVAPAYYLPMSIFSIKFGGPHSGILIALLDVFGFAATVPFKLYGGAMADRPGGWTDFFSMLITIAFLSMIVTWLFLKGEARLEEANNSA